MLTTISWTVPKPLSAAHHVPQTASHRWQKCSMTRFLSKLDLCLPFTLTPTIKIHRMPLIQKAICAEQELLPRTSFPTAPARQKQSDLFFQNSRENSTA